MSLHLSQSVIAQMMDCRRKGMTIPAIHQVLVEGGIRLSESTVYLAVRDVTTPKRAHKPEAKALAVAGYSYEEIADRFSISKSCVQKWCRGIGVLRGWKRQRQIDSQLITVAQALEDLPRPGQTEAA